MNTNSKGVSVVIKVEQRLGCELREGDSVVVKPNAISTVTKIKKICGFRELKKARTDADRIAVFEDNTARVVPGDEMMIVLFPVTSLTEVYG